MSIKELPEMLDITEPSAPVEISIRADGAVLWVNIGNRCFLRVCRIPHGHIIIDDRRKT